MKNIASYIVLLFVIFSCQNQAETNPFIADDLSETKADYQKTIVGHLSGEYKLADNTFLKSRWSKEERNKAKRYLMELIGTLNIIPRENNYTAPNLNPAIDLLLDPFTGTNVYGILPATKNTAEYIVLGAHYDTGKRNAPGAIDNATGIALIYSVVKELSKSQVRNKNIVIVFFDQEEEELIGSKAFATFLSEKNWNIHSVHCFDMVGWDADHDRAMEIYSASEVLISAYKETANRHNIPLKDIRIDPVNYDKSSTDFDAFVPHGFNAIGAGECYYFRDSTPYKDSPDDTFQTVDFEYLLSCSNLIADIIKEMALQ